MAYHDALFQLGMDLTRSSTAQKEDHGQIARVARKPVTQTSTSGESKDHLVERDSVRFAKHHLIIDLHGASKLDDMGHIERTLERCVEVAGAKLLHTHLHRTSPAGGVSGLAVLDDGHISVHSRPDGGYVAFDLLMGEGTRPQLCLDVLGASFGTRDMTVRSCQRGDAAISQMLEPAKARKAPARPARQRVRTAA